MAKIKLSDSFTHDMEFVFYHSARLEALIDLQEDLLKHPTKTFERSLVKIYEMIDQEREQSLKAIEKAKKTP